jgi:nitrogen fixation protein
MFERNDTQASMDAVLKPEDHAYIMREARRIDASGLEAEKRCQIVDFRNQTAQMAKDKADAKVKRDAEVLKKQLERPLVSPAAMDTLTVAKIVDQLNSYWALGVPNIPKTSHLKYKADKLDALKVAHKWYHVNGDPTVLPEMPTVVPQVVEDWTPEEDIEMEE